ncbi:MAG: SUMF1/EgtB/PvdO family nonheme iron enzyme [Candidatus Aminicenantes bacterium]|nr:SUMF1/EgtB/PvdO family nonheme iron enzyme [Candidatus Aminicenantes bacterium]
MESLNDDVSPYGVYFMGSRTVEWCRDWYGSAYYAISLEKNPTGPASGTFRVVRGGNHNSDAEGLRSAKRHSVEPLDNTQAIGFRIVKEK